jgi:hypothetical protein
MAMGMIQPPTEMSTNNLPGGKGTLTHRADSFTTVNGLTTLSCSTGGYRNSFTTYILHLLNLACVMRRSYNVAKVKVGDQDVKFKSISIKLILKTG